VVAAATRSLITLRHGKAVRIRGLQMRKCRLVSPPRPPSAKMGCERTERLIDAGST